MEARTVGDNGEGGNNPRVVTQGAPPAGARTPRVGTQGRGASRGRTPGPKPKAKGAAPSNVGPRPNRPVPTDGLRFVSFPNREQTPKPSARAQTPGPAGTVGRVPKQKDIFLHIEWMNTYF